MIFPHCLDRYSTKLFAVGAVPEIARFGVFELNLRTGVLRKNGIKIRLPEQPLRILALLLERPGELMLCADSTPGRNCTQASLMRIMKRG